MNRIDILTERLSTNLAGLAELIGGRTKRQHVEYWRASGKVPPHAVKTLVKASAGSMREWEFRPGDWHLIWPELIGTPGAPLVPATEQEVRDAA